MGLTLAQLPAQTKTFLGILSGLQPSAPVPFFNLFNSAPVIAGNISTNKITWNYLIRKEHAADLRKRGVGEASFKKVKDTSWVKTEIEPGEIIAKQSLTADELSQLQPDTTEEFYIGGQTIATNEQLAEMKFMLIKDSMTRRMDIMCAQLINDGKVYLSNGVDYFDFGLPAADSVTYSSTNGFLKVMKGLIQNYRKRTGRLPNRVLIGTDIVDAMLQDEKLQQSMYNLGFTNVGKDVMVNNMGLVLGTFMGLNLEQMDFSFDEKGDDIIAGNVIKLLDTTSLRRGYAPIDVIDPATKLPTKWNGAEWTGIEIESEINASATLYGKSAFFPIVTDPVTIQTATVTIA